MLPINRLLERLGLIRSTSTPRKYGLDEKLENVLESMAEKQQRSTDEIAADLIGEALARQQVDKDTWKRWLLCFPA